MAQANEVASLWRLEEPSGTRSTEPAPSDEQSLTPMDMEEAESRKDQRLNENSRGETEPAHRSEESTEKAGEDSDLEDANEQLQGIVRNSKQNTRKTIDALNFIQPSLDLSEEQQDKVDQTLTRAEQQQLLVLWRATLSRNKTINFIVQKMAPETDKQKKARMLSHVLNTAVLLPFYAIQTVSPSDTSAFASYLGAGVANDLIQGHLEHNQDKLILTQTEMVIMFMMLDQVAERVRNNFHQYKQNRMDAYLARQEMNAARKEASAALEIDSPEAKFLSQIRIRQLERELRRINLRTRSSRIVLVDLAGQDAVEQVDKAIDREFEAIADMPIAANI
jgi:5S rRNA maturation endonuclease (ribonuclease M5)